MSTTIFFGGETLVVHEGFQYWLLATVSDIIKQFYIT
jgi:hypothetical protein